jgi:AAA domain-containing protein
VTVTDRDINWGEGATEFTGEFGGQPSTDSVSGQPLGVAVATESELPFMTAAAVAQAAPEKVDWIIPGFVAPGVITEIDGKLKSSGKTTFIGAMTKAIVTGGCFLNRQTKQARVVWLTEERAQTFGETLRRAGIDTRTDIHVLHWHSVKHLRWPILMSRVADYAMAIEAKVVIVDTISQWAGLRGDAENNNGSQMEAAAPLQDAAAKGLAIGVARHERKGGGEVGESGRGGSAFSGAVDVVVSIRRGEGKTKPTVRVLQALSRFSETPSDLVIDLTSDGYVVLGDTASVATLEAEQALIDRLPTNQTDAADLEALRVAEPVIAKTSAKTAMARLYDSGKARRIGSGKRGDAYRYFLPVKDSVATQTYRSDQQPETWGSDANRV